MKKMEFEYFNGMEAEQYSFYRIPKMLFTEGCFKQLSCEAKVLYGLLLDRMGLSVKNRWIDEKNRVYIMFTVEDIMELLNCGKQKAVRCLAELDSEKGIGLVEKKRLGLGRPNVLYVKNFMQKGGADQNPGHSLENESGQEPVNMIGNESGLEPERGMDSECSVDLEDGPKNGHGQKTWNDIGHGESRKPGYDTESKGSGVTGQRCSVGYQQECEEQNFIGMGTEVQKIIKTDLQNHEEQIFGIMGSEIRESLETGEECEEQNWWEMDHIHQESVKPGLLGDRSWDSEKMAVISQELMELFGGGQDLSGDFLEEQEPVFQKYENHTSRSSRIILQEVPKPYSWGYGCRKSG